MRNDLSTEKESDIPTPTKKNPLTSLSYTQSRCLGMTIICLVVALAITVGMVACERAETETEKETEAETETEAGSVENLPDTTEANSLPADSPHFSFGYKPFDGFAIPGDLIYIDTYVVNEGSPFTYEGSSRGFAPTASLVHRENGYRIQGNFATTMDLVRFTVSTGDKGQTNQVFAIPANAPTGEYDLYLSFNKQEQVFENALTVAIP